MPISNTNKFRVREDTDVDLRKWPTAAKPLYDSKEHYKELLENQIAQLSAQQELLYSTDRNAVLLIFQAMDAAGKDGAIKHVMSGVNPQGCQVYSFKHPSAAEMQHDFLWRSVCKLPERRFIGVFNRSYYEEVLIVRVHPEFLHANRAVDSPNISKSIWNERFRSITTFEQHLHRNGTRIVKFFLHLSNEEQRKRLLNRVDDATKSWKVSPADVEEREYWDDYMRAYEDCLAATSKTHAPWFIVPADDKRNARLIIAQIVLDTLKELKMAHSKESADRHLELEAIRQRLKA